ncbi:flippase [Candidatus Sumerlaeota bacterium]|nr:flippase [Candidatus Sumerlaeota bacterium]
MAVAVTIYLTRVLDKTNYGIMVFAVGALAWANLIADFGLTMLGQREIARSHVPQHHMVRVVVGIQVVFSVIAFIALVAFALVLPAKTPLITREVVFLYGLALPISAFDLRWVFYGMEKMWIVGVAETITQGILTIGALSFVTKPEHLVFLPMVYLAAQFIPMLFVLGRYTRLYGFPVPSLESSMLRHLLRDALPLCGSAAIGMVLANFATLIIPIRLDMEHMGHYGAAQRIVWVPTLFIAAYYLTLRPTLSRAYVEGLESITGLLRKSVRLTTALAMGMMTGGLVLGVPFIRFAFGPEFDGAIASFEILVLATGLLFINRLFRGILICFNHQVAEFKMMLAAAMTNVVFALALIDRFGASGVAFATFLGEAVMLAMGYIYTRYLVGRIAFGRYLLRPLICCLMMAAVLYFTSSLHVVARIVVGGGFYLAALAALRVIQKEDVMMIAHALLPRRAPSSESTA